MSFLKNFEDPFIYHDSDGIIFIDDSEPIDMSPFGGMD